MRFSFLILLLLAIGAVLLATQPDNMDPLRIALPFTGDPGLQFSGPTLLVLAATFLAGFGLGYLATLPGRIGAGRRARRAEKQLEAVETTRGTVATAEGRAAEARADASRARADAADARTASHDAQETQRLADEVARRTADTQRTPPKP